LITMLRTAFPDLHFAIEDLIAEGDTVAGRLTMNGTHTGPLMGMPPTRRAIRQAHMHFVRFRDGKAVEHSLPRSSERQVWKSMASLSVASRRALLPSPTFQPSASRSRTASR
jgi:hypothetical protein